MHPAAAADTYTARKHKIFITSSLLVGGVALVVLPLHLALAGPTSLALTFGVSWALGQWPLAMYLSQTGNLPRAHAYAAALFAVFIGVVAAFSGGLHSYALPWLVLVPVQAALSGNRKSILSLLILCAGGLAGFAFASPYFASHATELTGAGEGGVALFALACAAMIAVQIGWDQISGVTALVEREQKLRFLADNVEEAVAVLGTAGEVISLDGAAEKLLGVTPRLVRGDGLFQRVHVADRPVFLKSVSDAQRGLAANFEMRVRTGSNEPGDVGFAGHRWMEMSCRSAEIGNAPVVVAVLRDISRRKQDDAAAAEARSSANAANEAKTRFLASLGHELKTPLNAVIGFADMLRSCPTRIDEPRREQYAGLIHESGLHMLEIVNDLLDMSKIESGHFELTIEPFNLVQAVDACRHMLAAEARDKDIEIGTEMDRTLTAFPADRRACKQIIINLLSNAIKYSPRSTRIIVGAKRNGNTVELYVNDRGSGIAAEHLKHLGEPYYRVPSSDPNRPSGTGLGLTVVKALATLHGGEVAIDSKPGRGTRVTVILPATAETASGRKVGNVVSALSASRASGATNLAASVASELVENRFAKGNMELEERMAPLVGLSTIERTRKTRAVKA